MEVGLPASDSDRVAIFLGYLIFEMMNHSQVEGVAYDDLRKVKRLTKTTEIIELPEGFSARLYPRIALISDSVPRNER